MKKMFVTAMSVALLLSACGGSSGGSSGSGGGSAQTDVADVFIDVVKQQDLQLDEECVRTNAARFSEDDAQAMVDAGVDGDPDISDDGDAISDEIFSECVDAESYLENLATSFSEDGSVDGDCMREALQGLSVAEIYDALFDTAFECATD